MFKIKPRPEAGPAGLHFSFDAFQNVLVLLYVIFLPFLRYGITVYYYAFTVSDFLLGLLFLTAVYDLIKTRIRLTGEIRTLFVLFGLFFIVLALSLTQARNILDGILDLLAYVYAGILIFTFSLYFSRQGSARIKYLERAVNLSLLVLTIGSFLWMICAPCRAVTSTPGLKYAFFLRNPNQLSMLTIVYFSMFLLFFSGRKDKFRLFFMSMPGLFVNIYLNTGSRAAFIVGGVLILIFYFIGVRALITDFARISKKGIRGLIFSVFCIGLVLWLHLAVFKSWTSLRAFSVLMPEGRSWMSEETIDAIRDDNPNILIRASGDIIRKEINAKALQVFKEHPFLGVGLGNFRNNYHPNEIHNSFLSILTESGIMGLFFLMLIFLFLLRLFWKYQRPQFLGYGGILGCVLLFNWIHYVLRERWVWLFILFFVVVSIQTDRSRKKIL